MHRLAMNITGATVLYFSRPCCPRRAASLAASLVGSPASTGPTRGPFRNNPPEAAARHIYGAGGYVHREAGKQQHTHHDPGGGRTGARSKHAVRDARIQTTHNAHRCASVDRAKYVHHTEMQHSFGLHETQTTLAPSVALVLTGYSGYSMAAANGHADLPAHDHKLRPRQDQRVTGLDWVLLLRRQLALNTEERYSKVLSKVLTVM